MAVAAAGADLFTDALAAYRITRLVTKDTITEDLRGRVVRWAYRRAGPRVYEMAADLLKGTPGLDPQRASDWPEIVEVDDEPPKLATLVTCPYCVGVYVGFAVLAARRLAPDAWRATSEALALAAGAALIAGLEKD